MERERLHTVAEQLLERARKASSGRASRPLCGGRGNPLQQMVIALAGGELLHEHENPGAATLQVLKGVVRLRGARAGEITLEAGDFAVIPEERHSVHAEEDSVVLLSVATRG